MAVQAMAQMARTLHLATYLPLAAEAAARKAVRQAPTAALAEEAAEAQARHPAPEGMEHLAKETTVAQAPLRRMAEEEAAGLGVRAAPDTQLATAMAVLALPILSLVQMFTIQAAEAAGHTPPILPAQAAWAAAGTELTAAPTVAMDILDLQTQAAAEAALTERLQAAPEA